MPQNRDSDDRVSRRRFEREKAARQQAERLLEEKSRDLYLANEQLNQYSEDLETTVVARTADLRRALEKAEAASTMRSRFVATMSHEIRTPLGELLGMIDLLYDDETDPSKREYLEYAKTSGDALKRIVNDVLDFSKMEAGAFHFENDKVDVRALIDSVIVLASTNMPDGENRLKKSISKSVPRLFSGDATRIRQVISNFVSNAGRYSTGGMIEVRASSADHEQGVLLRVEVEDQGIGIAPDQQEDLFKDFTQVPNKLTAAAQGTGLGLAICKRIVEGIGGTIGVRSVPGQGATFWFEIPVDVIDADAHEQVPAPRRPKQAEHKITGARILLAEDNTINQKLLLTFLGRMKADVQLAENGLVVIEKFKPGEFDLLLMDVAMPEMDGLQAIRIIRDTWAPDLVPPILLLTAHVMQAIQEESESVGVTRVLSKPISYDDLQAAIAEAIPEHDLATADTPPEPPNAPVLAMMGGVADLLAQEMTPTELVDFIHEFITDTRRLIGSIVEHHGRGHTRAVVAEAHALKGSSGLLGFEYISEQAALIEEHAADIDHEAFVDLTKDITVQVDEIERVLG